MTKQNELPTHITVTSSQRYKTADIVQWITANTASVEDLGFPQGIDLTAEMITLPILIACLEDDWYNDIACEVGNFTYTTDTGKELS